MQQIEHKTSNHATAPTIQIPAEIHAHVKAVRQEYRDRTKQKTLRANGGNLPTLAGFFVYFAFRGIEKILLHDTRPVFVERGVQPKSEFVGCKIAYPTQLRAHIQEILTRIKAGEFQSRPKPPKTVVSMRCIFITLVELGIGK